MDEKQAALIISIMAQQRNSALDACAQLSAQLSLAQEQIKMLEGKLKADEKVIEGA